jgi:DNA-binding transcriptional MerR regulator
MPYKEKEIEKLYYTIGEVAQLFGVNTSHIRFWSNEFDVIRPSTNKKGNRMYTRDDIENFRKIYHLVKEKGYTLRGAKTELKDMKNRPAEVLVAAEPDHEITAEGQVSLFDTVTTFERPNTMAMNESASDDDYVNRMAIRSSLEKMRHQLLDLRKEINDMAKA